MKTDLKITKAREFIMYDTTWCNNLGKKEAVCSQQAKRKSLG
jgi:hypothetical protein